MRGGESLSTYLEQHIEHFRQRVLQDALSEAMSSYWQRRAEAFYGVGTPACDEIAQACLNAAALALLQGDQAPAALMCPTCGTPTSPWTCSCGETRVEEAS